MAVLAYILAIFVIAYWPVPVDRPVYGAVHIILAAIHRAGLLTSWASYAVVEAATNVALFIPLGALASLLFTRSIWWFAGILGLALSLCAEFGQEVFLPHRSASVGDLIANTCGALIGGATIATLRLIHDAYHLEGGRSAQQLLLDLPELAPLREQTSPIDSEDARATARLGCEGNSFSYPLGGPNDARHPGYHSQRNG